MVGILSNVVTRRA